MKKYISDSLSLIDSAIQSHVIFDNNRICIYSQGFIQAILMSGRRHKILNLLIEFSSSIFIKFVLKHIGVELAFNIN